MARIALAEDDPRYRQTLTDALVLLGGHEVVASFRNGQTAALEVARLVALRAACPWELFITDLEMPEKDGVALTSELKQAFPRLPVLVLTVFEHPPSILDAISAGCDGYVLKQASGDEIVEHVAVLLAGGSPLTPSVARVVLGSLRSGGARGGSGSRRPRIELTGREQDVLRCLVAGSAYKEVADELDVSLDTVRTHIRGLYRKLQVNNVGSAIAAALRDGLV